MLFNSLDFAFFFPLVVLFYFGIPQRFRWMLLLAASYYFYMCWKPEYAILLMLSTGISYGTGLLMGGTSVKARKKAYLLVSLTGNLGLLFWFKYADFVNDSLRATFQHFNIFYGVPGFDIILPVGISFFVFQSLSYSFDVYRNDRPPEKHAGIFALYVAFFPQLVAGPIERSTSLLPQFFQRHDFDYQRVTDGLKLMLWGLFKKVVIADRLAVVVDHVYGNPAGQSGYALLIATYFFAFQIYCDFSGYSDMAIGGAKVMGFDLMKNFNRPYAAQSISDFWRRWHISLSTWFKDYLYFPLGGNRVSKSRWYANLMAVFLVSGLWHGANWTYVIWGALHGFYLIFALAAADIRAKAAAFLRLDKYPGLLKGMRIFITFHLVLFAWVFFRADSLSDAIYILSHIFQDLFQPIGTLDLGMTFDGLLLALMVILFMEAVHLLQRRPGGALAALSEKPTVLRWAVYLFLTLSVLNLRVEHQAPFIYFQF